MFVICFVLWLLWQLFFVVCGFVFLSWKFWEMWKRWGVSHSDEFLTLVGFDWDRQGEPSALWLVRFAGFGAVGLVQEIQLSFFQILLRESCAFTKFCLGQVAAIVTQILFERLKIHDCRIGFGTHVWRLNAALANWNFGYLGRSRSIYNRIHSNPATALEGLATWTLRMSEVWRLKTEIWLYRYR